MAFVSYDINLIRLLQCFVLWLQTECQVGKFSYNDREPCRPCPKGFYQDTEGEQSCTQQKWSEYNTNVLEYDYFEHA